MDYCGAKQNQYLNILYIEDLNYETILSVSTLTDKFWYILDQCETLVGLYRQ